MHALSGTGTPSPMEMNAESGVRHGRGGNVPRTTQVRPSPSCTIPAVEKGTLSDNLITGVHIALGTFYAVDSSEPALSTSEGKPRHVLVHLPALTIPSPSSHSLSQTCIP